MVLRIFYTADLHGSDRCFRKMLNAATFYKADVLIIGGDVTGKMVVPFVRNPDGTFRSEWLEKKRMKVREVEEYENNFLNSGLYTCRISPEEMAELEANPQRQYPLFNRLMQERLRSWIGLAEQRLRPLNRKIHVIPGNDDRFEVDAEMKTSETFVYCEGELVDIGGYEVASCGFTNPTPWNTPREVPDEVLGKKLEGIVSKISRPERAIFNFHCPPSGTPIDLAPQLTKDMRIKQRAGTVSMMHVGSDAVRAIHERHQPLLGLHGHIHESRGEAMVGSTLCLNPGSEYNQGVLQGVLVDLEEGRIARHQFTVG